jgi:hypothetical protein
MNLLAKRAARRDHQNDKPSHPHFSTNRHFAQTRAGAVAVLANA